jgi:TIR domain
VVCSTRFLKLIALLLWTAFAKETAISTASGLELMLVDCTESEVPYVFISYVRQNSDVVDQLAEELRNSGIRVWLDRNDIEPGARWRDAIKKAIRSGKYFIACFSKEYDERNKTYMNEELTLAVDELRERPSDKTWFIPILINQTRVPSRRISSVEDLSDLQATRLYEDWNAGINKILRVLRMTIRPPRAYGVWSTSSKALLTMNVFTRSSN